MNGRRETPTYEMLDEHGYPDKPCKKCQWGIVKNDRTCLLLAKISECNLLQLWVKRTVIDKKTSGAKPKHGRFWL